MPAYLESLFANKGGAKRKCELNDVSSREMLALSVAAMTQLTYPSGPNDKLRWHPAIIIEAIASADGKPENSTYIAFVITDSETEPLPPPFPAPGACFAKATSQATFKHFGLTSKGPLANAQQLAHAKRLAAQTTAEDD